MKKSNNYYKLNKDDKDKIMLFYFAPSGTGAKFWKEKIDEIKQKKGKNKC